jgi:hypothetical protein
MFCRFLFITCLFFSFGHCIVYHSCCQHFLITKYIHVQCKINDWNNNGTLSLWIFTLWDVRRYRIYGTRRVPRLTIIRYAHNQKYVSSKVKKRQQAVENICQSKTSLILTADGLMFDTFSWTFDSRCKINVRQVCCIHYTIDINCGKVCIVDNLICW